MLTSAIRIASNPSNSFKSRFTFNFKNTFPIFSFFYELNEIMDKKITQAGHPTSDKYITHMELYWCCEMLHISCGTVGLWMFYRRLQPGMCDIAHNSCTALS